MLGREVEKEILNGNWKFRSKIKMGIEDSEIKKKGEYGFERDKACFVIRIFEIKVDLTKIIW